MIWTLELSTVPLNSVVPSESCCSSPWVPPLPEAHSAGCGAATVIEAELPSLVFQAYVKSVPSGMQ